LKRRIYLTLGVPSLGWLSLGIGISAGYGLPAYAVDPVPLTVSTDVALSQRLTPESAIAPLAVALSPDDPDAVQAGEHQPASSPDLSAPDLSAPDLPLGADHAPIAALEPGPIVSPAHLDLEVSFAPTQGFPLNAPLFTPSESSVGLKPALAQGQDNDDDTEEPPFEGVPLDQDTELPPGDPELGVIQVRSPLEDPDLGILRIREQPPLLIPPPDEPPKIGFLTARFLMGSSDNILLVIDDVGNLTGDTFFRPSLTFEVYPTLGPETTLIGTIDAALQRYGSQSSVNYDDLRFRVGIRQGLSPRTYGQLTVSYQELFRPGPNRFRFFENTAIALTLGRRDPLTPQLSLDTYYRAEYNDATVRSNFDSGPVLTDFSRFSQVIGAYLAYRFNPQLQAGLSYQVTLVDYAAQARHDTFQQLLGQVVYSITPTVRLSAYGGFGFGRSSEPRVRFDDTLFGLNLEVNLPLF